MKYPIAMHKSNEKESKIAIQIAITKTELLFTLIYFTLNMGKQIKETAAFLVDAEAQINSLEILQ